MHLLYFTFIIFTTSLFLRNCLFLSIAIFLFLFIHLPRNGHIEQLCCDSNLFLGRVFLFGEEQEVEGGEVPEKVKRWGSWFVFHVPLRKQNLTWLLLDFAFVSMPALLWCQWELAQLQCGRDYLWARAMALMMVWGLSCQSIANFMFLLLKHSFPDWSRTLLWSNFIIWSSAKSFSSGNGVLHQKKKKKSQTISRSPAGDFK